MSESSEEPEFEQERRPGQESDPKTGSGSRRVGTRDPESESEEESEHVTRGGSVEQKTSSSLQRAGRSREWRERGEASLTQSEVRLSLDELGGVVVLVAALGSVVVIVRFITVVIGVVETCCGGNPSPGTTF